METYVLRVWLPDRPGALGQVASRIGAVRGDVIGIDILERGGGRAVDDLVISLPEGSDIDLLLSEVAQVDGVAVEDVRRVASDRPEPGILALEVAARLAESAPEVRLRLLCDELRDLVDADWVAVLSVRAERMVMTLGVTPDQGWLGAFLEGSSHLSAAAQAAGAPGDLAWTRLPRRDLAVAVGRRGRPFHTRERQHLALLGRVADALMPPV